MNETKIDLSRLGTQPAPAPDPFIPTEPPVRRHASPISLAPSGPPGERHKVLVIAGRFPPVASVGATRVRKFVKYLPSLGWDCSVLTGAMRRARPAEHDLRRTVDERSLEDLPADLSVHRLGPAADHWPTYFARWCSSHLAPITRQFGIDETRWSSLLKWRFRNLHDRLAFPDRGIWRLPAAVKLALRLHREHHFDAIFSSGMPFSDHLIALALHVLLRLPWIADFRDPWVEYLHWQEWQTDWGRRLAQTAEAAVVQRATRVVSVNEHMTERFAARYRHEPAGKFVTVANGFDPADFPARPTRTDRTHFRLLYAGSLHPTRSPRKLLEAFRRFIRQTPGAAGRARFEYAARPGPLADELKDAADGQTVQFLGLLPHADALAAMASADVNVMALPNLPGSEGETTTKLYEYLGSGRPLLAAVPIHGAAAGILRGFDGVWLRDPDDVEGMTEAITDIYGRWLAGDLTIRRPAGRLELLTRKNQACKLASCLDTAVAARGASRRTV